MSEMDAMRAAIADRLVALERLDPQDHAALEKHVEAAVDGFDPGMHQPSDPERAELHRLLRDYRALRELRADRNNVRLAEKGEVFAPEDDA